MAFVYILKCSDNTLYTGYAKNVDKRLAEHNLGKGAKYTRCRLPVELLYTEELPSVGDALRREIAIKKMTRPQKLKLIKKNIL